MSRDNPTIAPVNRTSSNIQIMSQTQYSSQSSMSPPNQRATNHNAHDLSACRGLSNLHTSPSRDAAVATTVVLSFTSSPELSEETARRRAKGTLFMFQNGSGSGFVLTNMG